MTLLNFKTMPIQIDDNTTRVTYLFLRRLGVLVTKGFLKKEIQTHPYYPSLAALSDILNAYKVDNSALRVSINDIESIPIPFIAHLNMGNGTFAIVEKITPSEVHFSLDEKKIKIISKTDFIKIWDNVILTASINDKSTEPNFYENRKAELLTTLKLPIFILASTFILISSFIINQPSVYFLPLFITKCIGLFFIWLLVKHELGLQSDLTDKLCTMTKSTGCNEVLNSKASKLFGVFQLADIGLVWFVSSYIYLLITSIKGVVQSDVNIFGWFALMSIPVIIFSISYQLLIVKKYCPLCLGVISMLVADTILLFTVYHFSFVLPQSYSLLLLSSSLIIVLFAWSVIKPFLMSRERSKNFEIKYLHLKRNPLVINSLLADSEEYDIGTIFKPVRITKSETDIVITEVINPYCNPCKHAFQKIEQLINVSNGQCPSIQFVFLTQTKDKENSMTKTAMHLIAIAEQNNPELMKEALSEWYRIMDYEKWSTTYPVMLEENHFNTLKDHAKWAAENNIQATPTTFVNTKMLPTNIEISDLRYILD